ncbi:MAG: 3-methyl-2-oxobutanoate hydroxymethyltransferase [Candidatus Lambdaproteobacteria bacterium]|nr:3-methyl-2-oxobutanoate hydroxymethyltransferase [Candidatus Lambdaproteobacteria bacterium]
MQRAIRHLVAQKGKSPIVMVTCYDATMARLVDEAVDCLLVGDSLGMVIQGDESTLAVTLDQVVYHTRMVARGSTHAVVIADLPFMSYQPSVEEAVRSAGRCLKEGLAHGVKVEGGTPVLPQVRALVGYGIPVVGHLGVTPQSIHALGGYGKKGKTEAEAARLMEESLALQEAGASMLVLENVPHELAKSITARLDILTIGIGAGPHCDGQVQVFHDLFGLMPDYTPRHAKRYTEAGRTIQQAIRQYAEEVRAGTFISK